MSINIANCLLSQQPFNLLRKPGRKLLALDFPELKNISINIQVNTNEHTLVL